MIFIINTTGTEDPENKNVKGAPECLFCRPLIFIFVVLLYPFHIDLYGRLFHPDGFMWVLLLATVPSGDIITSCMDESVHAMPCIINSPVVN